MLPNPVTEEIRRRADLVEVVTQYLALAPAGSGRWKACCPFHDEKTPSFYVSRDKGFYKCFGCGAAGDVFRFVREMEHVGFMEARNILASRYGIIVPAARELDPARQAELSERARLAKIAAAAAAFFREQFAGNRGMPARDYARLRGLSRDTLETFGVGYAPDAWDGLRAHLVRRHGFAEADCIRAGLLVARRPSEPDADANSGDEAASEASTGTASNSDSPGSYDRYRHRLIFPIWDESGRTIAFGGRLLEGGKAGPTDAKYINSPDGPLFHKGSVLFAWHLARAEAGRREEIIVTEGYMDAIALHQAGFPHTVATLGTALTPHHVSLLKRLAPRHVYLCFDGDSAGMKAAMRTAPLFAQHALPVFVVRLPGQHDPDTFLRAEGPAAMQLALAHAVPLSRYRLETLIEPWPQLDLSDRAQALAQAAQVVNDESGTVERDAYRMWLIDRLVAFEAPPTRREYDSRREALSKVVDRELAQDEKRYGAQLRAREIRQGEGRGALAPPAPSSPSATTGGLSTLPQGGGVPAVPSPEGRNYIAELMLRQPGETAPPGVLKAQKHLLSVLLAHPAWRAHILRALPLERWSGDAYGELICAVGELPEGEELEAGVFTADLGTEAAGIAGEVLLWDDAARVPDGPLIDGWVEVVERFWARQAEHEMLEMVLGKMKRNEPVPPEEREVLTQALRRSGRQQPVPPP